MTTRFAVFDLDGTLVDSRRDLANAANALVLELGGRPLEEAAVAAMVGEGAAVLVKRVLAAANLDAGNDPALQRFLELYEARLVEHTVSYRGIVEALDALAARMPLALLSNKPQRATDEVMRLLGLSRYFVDVLGGDTPVGRKPDPTGLLSLCARANVTPGETVLVGDSTIDLETARRAGTGIVLVGYGFGPLPPVLAPHERMIDSPAGIVDALSG